AILEKKIGNKDKKNIYELNKGVKTISTIQKELAGFCLNKTQIVDLSKYVIAIEEYFSILKGESCPMDITWALDGLTNELFIIQAKPETFHSKRDKDIVISYRISEVEKAKAILKGIAIGEKIGAGEVKI